MVIGPQVSGGEDKVSGQTEGLLGSSGDQRTGHERGERRRRRLGLMGPALSGGPCGTSRRCPVPGCWNGSVIATEEQVPEGTC